jgi:MSHA biogenesis protein MshK
VFKLLLNLLVVMSACFVSNAFARDRDPTMPLSGMEAALEIVNNKLVLESILISGSRKIAVINGQTTMQNQMVDGALIVSITAQRVTVKHKGELKKLNLILPSIKSRDGVSQGY